VLYSCSSVLLQEAGSVQVSTIVGVGVSYRRWSPPPKNRSPIVIVQVACLLIFSFSCVLVSQIGNLFAIFSTVVLYISSLNSPSQQDHRDMRFLCAVLVSTRIYGRSIFVRPVRRPSLGMGAAISVIILLITSCMRHACVMLRQSVCRQ